MGKDILKNNMSRIDKIARCRKTSTHIITNEKHKMLDPKTVAEKITDMVSDNRKYGIGVSVDQRESFFLLNVSEIRHLQNCTV